ncbi:MAG: hypothetical protein E7593_04380 [Ruminococcaceae bacterium]|nr:hypothetical protein [Oscillospiraceae bacterium]
MKEKKDIFNGKVKKEYFLYILICMIFIALLMFVVGGMILGVGLWANAGSEVAIFFMRILGLVIIAMGIAYVVGCMLVIRKYPKYQRLRRILYNSDCYFTDSDSTEYYGKTRGIRGRRHKASFDLVTRFAEAKNGMGDRKPVRYIVYSALSLFMGLLELIILIAGPILFEKGTIFPNVSDKVFIVCCMLVGIICLLLAIFFICRAYKAALMAPLENYEWRFELYTLLVNISIRQNNKKLKFWYKRDQVGEIENLVKSVSEKAELKLETKANKLVSFKVIDILNDRTIFKGYFI